MWPCSPNRAIFPAFCSWCFSFQAGSGAGAIAHLHAHCSSIAVQPGDAEASTPAGTAPFTATGTFDQPPMTEDNLNARWSSSDTTVATVDANTGLATCVSVGGPVVITASSNAKQGTAELTCSSSVSTGSGNCVYLCGSTRCGALSGLLFQHAGKRLPAGLRSRKLSGREARRRNRDGLLWRRYRYDPNVSVGSRLVVHGDYTEAGSNQVVSGSLVISPSTIRQMPKGLPFRNSSGRVDSGNPW